MWGTEGVITLLEPIRYGRKFGGDVELPKSGHNERLQLARTRHSDIIDCRKTARSGRADFQIRHPIADAHWRSHQPEWPVLHQSSGVALTPVSVIEIFGVIVRFRTVCRETEGHS